jgi:hypothetical protein
MKYWVALYEDFDYDLDLLSVDHYSTRGYNEIEGVGYKRQKAEFTRYDSELLNFTSLVNSELLNFTFLVNRDNITFPTIRVAPNKSGRVVTAISLTPEKSSNPQKVTFLHLDPYIAINEITNPRFPARSLIFPIPFQKIKKKPKSIKPKKLWDYLKNEDL